MATRLLKKRPAREYCFFAEAWILLALSRSLIYFMPFRKLLPLLGKQVTQPEANHAASEPVASEDLLKTIQISILRAARRSPWRTMCFEQAITARMMLRRRNIKSVIFFGVNINSEKQDEKMTAHAWLICSDFTVTGGKNNNQFAVVGRFWV